MKVRDRPCPRGRLQRGFTLLEVLAALTIFAFAGVALLEATAGSLRNAAVSSAHDRALMYAESRMTEAVQTPYLEAGRRVGRFDDPDYRWELRVTPYADGTVPGNAVRQLMSVRVRVRWSGGRGERHVELWTLKLQSRAAMP